MANTIKGSARQERHRQRLQWLRDHPELLASLPSARMNVNHDQSRALLEAVSGMKDAGLYARTSQGVGWGIRLLVSELRGDPLEASYRSTW